MSKSVIMMADSADSIVDGAMTLREIEEFCVEARAAGAQSTDAPRVTASMRPAMNAQGACIRQLAWKAERR